MTRIPVCSLLFFSSVAISACGDADPAASPADLSCGAPAEAAPEALDLYLDGLTEPDPGSRACQLQRSLADDAEWIFAAAQPKGRAAVRVALEESTAARIEAAAVRELVGEPLFRHEEALVRWVVRDENGDAVGRGDDWIEFAEDGTIRRIHTAAGTGPAIPFTEELLAWERAWNLRDEPAQRAALELATTADVRFSDLLVDVQGRDALLEEIQRQQGLFDANLDLGERFEVHAQDDGVPVFLRHEATIENPAGGAIEIVNFIRLRDGRVERLSGYPLASL